MAQAIHLGYATVQNDQVKSFDLQGNQVGVWYADSPSTGSEGNPGDALSGGGSSSLWKKVAAGVNYVVKATLPALPASVTMPAYFVTLFNQEPASAIAEGDHSDNRQLSTLVTITDYVGIKNDQQVDFGKVYTGQSATTYLTIANHTDDTVIVTDVRFAVGQSAYSFPTMDAAEAQAFALAHGLPAASFLNSMDFITNRDGGPLIDPMPLSRSDVPPGGMQIDPNGRFASLLVRFAPSGAGNAPPNKVVITLESVRTGLKWSEWVELKGEATPPPRERRGARAPLYVIVHGALNPSIPQWTRDMQHAIEQADPWFMGVPSADNFIVFDWTTEAVRLAPGFAQAAAERLATQIVAGIQHLRDLGEIAQSEFPAFI